MHEKYAIASNFRIVFNFFFFVNIYEHKKNARKNVICCDNFTCEYFLSYSFPTSLSLMLVLLLAILQLFCLYDSFMVLDSFICSGYFQQNEMIHLSHVNVFALNFHIFCHYDKFHTGYVYQNRFFSVRFCVRFCVCVCGSVFFFIPFFDMIK